MNVDTLVFLRNSIEKMDISKHIEILKILKKHDIEYSENNNGIFVNLTDISDDIQVGPQLEWILEHIYHPEISIHRNGEVSK